MQQQSLDFTALGSLTYQESAVWELLRTCQGRQMAMKRDEIVELTGLHERKVRQIISDLVNIHGYPIGSAQTGKMGYFVINTTEEAEKIVNDLRGRAIKILVRASKIGKISKINMARQVELDLMRC